MTLNRAVPPKPPRMTLASITKGRVSRPLRVLLYGVPGVGKTTFAAAAPSPIFLGAEDGSDQHDVARFPVPENWRDVRAAAQMLATEEHPYRTLVIDTLDSLEPLCWAEVVRRDSKASSIEDVGGGYGKGYVAAVDEWRGLVSDLERLRDKGIGVVALAHSVVRTFKNPSGPDYDRFVLKLHDKAAGLFVEHADAVLFAQFEEVVSAERGKRAKGLHTGARVIRTVRSAAWEAKNRHDLPDPLPLDYVGFAEAVTSHRPAAAGDIRAQIDAHLAQVPEETAAKVRAAVAAAGEDSAQLARIVNRLVTLTSDTTSNPTKGA